MKKVFYTAPAIVLCVIYGSLILLAGQFASLELKAWLTILLPVVSAVLLNKGYRWGFLPGLALGLVLMGLGAFGAGSLWNFDMILGAILALYYAAMGIVAAVKK